MHWSEWAALALLIVGVVALLALTGVILVLGYAIIASFLKTRKRLARARTSFGEMVKHDTLWCGTIRAKGVEVSLFARDRDGSPNPEWLGRLPAILVRLEQLEQTARREVNTISERHLLTSISDGYDVGVDVNLKFECEDHGDETVSVDFREGRIVGSAVFD
jgi:hypothetical protein